MSDQTLRPCPFCGNPAVSPSPGIAGLAGCKSNDCDGARSNGWMHTAAWNTRPVEDALRAEVDRLRAAIEAAVDALPEWSKGALAHLSPAEVVADEVRMALRDALAKAEPPVTA
jgi:hypothetical protein